MANFKGYLQGDTNEVTKFGSAIYAKVNGWNLGVNVFARLDDYGVETISVTLTGGTNGEAHHEPQFTAQRRKDKRGKSSFIMREN